MIKLVPEQHQRELSIAIDKGEFDSVKKIIEQNSIDVDVFIDNNFYEPILIKVLLSYGISNESERLKMLRYVLEKGANPNIKC